MSAVVSCFSKVVVWAATRREGAGFIKAGHWLASDPSPFIGNPTGCTLGGSKARSNFPKHSNEDVNGSWQDGFYPSGVQRVSEPLMESCTGHLQILVLIPTAQDKRWSETQTCPWTAIRPQALVASLCSRQYLNNSLSSLLSHIVVQFVVPSLVGEDLFSFFFFFFFPFLQAFSKYPLVCTCSCQFAFVSSSC